LEETQEESTKREKLVFSVEFLIEEDRETNIGDGLGPQSPKLCNVKVLSVSLTC
jgi:hypothetical protein